MERTAVLFDDLFGRTFHLPVFKHLTRYWYILRIFTRHILGGGRDSRPRRHHLIFALFNILCLLRACAGKSYYGSTSSSSKQKNR